MLSLYLKMIVANDGAKFAAKRGLALPDAKLVEDEDDNVALTFVSHLARPAGR